MVCGRYGEYVCEATDADVCSRDCKRRNTVAVAANSTERYVYTPMPTSGADQDRAAHGIDVQGRGTHESAREAGRTRTRSCCRAAEGRRTNAGRSAG